MKKSLPYIIVGIVAYLIFTVSTVPASRVYVLMKEKYPLPLQLFSISGSIWHGRAAQAVIGPQTFESVTWSWRPFALFRGRLEYAVSMLYGQQPLSLNAGMAMDGSIELSDVTAQLDMSLLERTVNPDPLGLTGTVAVDLSAVRLQAGRVQLVEGELSWQNGGIGAPMNVSLGSYQASFVTDHDTIHGKISDTGGPVILDARLDMQPGGQYQLVASLSARDRSDQQVRKALGFLGTPSPEGKVTLRRTGRLTVPVLTGR